MARRSSGRSIGNPRWVDDAKGQSIYKWDEIGLTSAIDTAEEMGFDVNSLSFASKEYYRYEYASLADIAELNQAMNEFYKVSATNYKKYLSEMEQTFGQVTNNDIGTLILNQAKSEMLPEEFAVFNDLTSKQIGDIITGEASSMSSKLLNKATKKALEEAGLIELGNELAALKKAIKITAKILTFLG